MSGYFSEMSECLWDMSKCLRDMSHSFCKMSDCLRDVSRCLSEKLECLCDIWKCLRAMSHSFCKMSYCLWDISKCFSDMSKCQGKVFVGGLRYWKKKLLSTWWIVLCWKEVNFNLEDCQPHEWRTINKKFSFLGKEKHISNKLDHYVGSYGKRSPYIAAIST